MSLRIPAAPYSLQVEPYEHCVDEAVAAHLLKTLGESRPMGLDSAARRNSSASKTQPSRW